MRVTSDNGAVFGSLPQSAKIESYVMVVRIRFAKRPAPVESGVRNRRMASLFATLLEPAAVAALALAIWRIAAGLQWVGNFAIPTGFFSYWQTWFAAAAGIQFCASALNRYGNGGGAAAG